MVCTGRRRLGPQWEGQGARAEEPGGPLSRCSIRSPAWIVARGLPWPSSRRRVMVRLSRCSRIMALIGAVALTLAVAREYADNGRTCEICASFYRDRDASARKRRHSTAASRLELVPCTVLSERPEHAVIIERVESAMRAYRAHRGAFPTSWGETDAWYVAGPAGTAFSLRDKAIHPPESARERWSPIGSGVALVITKATPTRYEVVMCGPGGERLHIIAGKDEGVGRRSAPPGVTMISDLLGGAPGRRAKGEISEKGRP
jgi:hypothetical protein